MANAQYGEVQASLFVAGAAFGEVQVSLFVAGAAFGEVQSSLFVAGAIFGEVGVSFFVAGAIFCETLFGSLGQRCFFSVENARGHLAKYPRVRGGLRTVGFILGSRSDHAHVQMTFHLFTEICLLEIFLFGNKVFITS